MNRKHYHLMNGSIGCIPDNNEVYPSYKAAYDGAKFLFDEMNRSEKYELRTYGIAYFYSGRSNEFGADYVEISGPCYDKECLDNEYSE